MKGMRAALLVMASGLMAACGGGGSGSGGGPLNLIGGGTTPDSGVPELPAYQASVFPPYSTLAGQCASPRPGTSDQRGSAHTEKMFLRSWSNDLYLWYQDLVDRNPASISVEDYFLDHLVSAGLDEGGQRKDRFHFTYDTAEYQALSQSGQDVGYGVQWSVVQAYPPREIIVAFVEPGSPAERAGVRRGDGLLEVDGVSVISNTSAGIVDLLNTALWPARAGEQHEFALGAAGYDPSDVGPRFVTLRAEQITIDPVPVVRTLDNQGVPVGYLLFNDHIATAEYELAQAVEQLQNDGVQELVLDVRYNGGGYLDIASQLAYMIAGPARTSGQVFQSLRFNDKHPVTNPVTGRPLVPVDFHDTTLGFSDSSLIADGTALPTLNLGRVYMIVGENTCSASEAIINGLIGVGVEVYLIGDTTCGKPYGFYARDNCGTTYFSVQFQTLNALGFGAYSGGFSPGWDGSVRLDGCVVEDDLFHELGDTDESRLNAALAFNASNHQQCSRSSIGASARRLGAEPRADGHIRKSPLRSNVLLREQASW